MPQLSLLSPNFALIDMQLINMPLTDRQLIDMQLTDRR